MKPSSANKHIIALILLVAWCMTPFAIGITADGRGVFRIAVTLSDSTTYKPIQGAKLTMKDAGADGLIEDTELKHLLPMFAPKTTGEFGDAFVYYFGGFSSETSQDGGMKYRQQVRGILVIEKDGFESLEIQLAKFIGPSFDSSRSIPLVELNLKPKAK